MQFCAGVSPDLYWRVATRFEFETRLLIARVWNLRYNSARKRCLFARLRYKLAQQRSVNAECPSLHSLSLESLPFSQTILVI